MLSKRKYPDWFVRSYPALFLIPALAVAALILVYLFIRRGAWWRAWFASCATIVAVTLFGVVGLFPRLLPSSIDPAYSLTIANSASSPLTLKIMLGVALTLCDLSSSPTRSESIFSSRKRPKRRTWPGKGPIEFRVSSFEFRVLGPGF